MTAFSGTTRGSPELLVELDRSKPEPLHRQLADGLRDAIRTGRLAPHTRLPSTRVLATDLGVSRRLVVDAYSQLAAEGFLLPRHGSATLVANVDTASAPTRAVRMPGHRYDIDFLPGTPDLERIKYEVWDANNLGNAIPGATPRAEIAVRGLLPQVPDAVALP